MTKLSIRLALLLLVGLLPMAGAQSSNQFPENPGEFIKQFELYVTANKQKAIEDLFKEFAKTFSGAMSAEEVEQTIRISNAMLGQRMSANPYFRDYMSAVLAAKQVSTGSNRFAEWADILEAMLSSDTGRKAKTYQDFLNFSADFFSEQVLRKGTGGGTSWYALTQEYQLQYADGAPKVIFGKIDLMSSRRTDSIYIRGTEGYYLPLEQEWHGKGGRVSWDRLGLGDDVHAEFKTYSIATKTSLYEVENAVMQYPLYFGAQKIEGKFSDKLVYTSEDVTGSYPRFESYTQVLKVDNVAKGVKYQGGFKLQGTTVYGFGTAENKARIQIYDDRDKLFLSGASELFTIRREERIVGERVEVSLHVGTDSIYHPSVNLRFQIPNREVRLERGQRGSDRNPFYSSYHQMNMETETINTFVGQDSMVFGKPTVAITRKGDVVFESLQFFEQNEYQRLQNIAAANPVAIMAATSEREGTNFIPAEKLAKRINGKFTVDNITSLLYDLVAKGFINYDSDKQMVEVKDKVKHYANADQGKTDYDVLRVVSQTQDINATMNLRSRAILANGVKNIELSTMQRVAFKPFGEQVLIKKNRSIDFDGQLFAGFARFQGRDFHFEYEPFHVVLDSVRYFDLFVPSEELDEKKQPIAKSLASRIEYLTGVLLIDAPGNKAGKENIAIFPSLQSKKKSFIFYDYTSTMEGAYARDSFYFELEPFSFNQLDDFAKSDVKFKGKLVSFGLFPDITETARIRDEDQSLGFVAKTPPAGYPIYQKKGKYTGEIDLSNRGMLGKGNVKYLGASIDSEDIVIKPKQLEGSAKKFNLEEDRSSDVRVPQVRGTDVTIDWLPYRDSMYIRSKEAPFALYKAGKHTLQGTMILTPSGLKGDGVLDWDKATMRSDLFSFGVFSATADTTEVRIKSFDTGELALKTDNVKSDVDFEALKANFKANDTLLITELPYNRYVTTMNEFDWDMKANTITFKADPAKPGIFTSVHPDKDSLRFQGTAAFYDIASAQLKVDGVPYVVAADAYIYPPDGHVDIEKGGKMTKLENARIVADTINKYHVINRATVEIDGRKEYKASGFYEYNVAGKEQEIELQDIVGTRVGKGSRSEKQSVTRATGEVTEDNNFYIDHKTKFKGTITLNAEAKPLQLEGFAYLDAEKLPYRYWFTVSSEGDRKDLTLKFDEPKSFEGEPLNTGLYLSKETSRLYPRAMAPLLLRKDRPIVPIKGVFKYNAEKDIFTFGDSSKVIRNELRGNVMNFDNRTGKVNFEGAFNIGSGLKYVKVMAAGTAATEFPPPAPEEEPEKPNMMSADPDEVPAAPPVPVTIPITAELMAGVQIQVPPPLMEEMIKDFKSSTFDTRLVSYLTDLDFYRKATATLFAPGKETDAAISGLTSGYLDIPAKLHGFNFLFSKLPMKWDADYQSFITTSTDLGVVSLGTETINKMITGHVEFKMPSNDDDRVYIYLKSPSELFYYFGYRQGVLSVVSNNPAFMEAFEKMKGKDLIFKMPDGETYEIQAIDLGTASQFVRRIEAANK